MTTAADRPARPASGMAIVLPLALAQFIASYAASNMNVAISAIAKDLSTTVVGMQTTITLFTLTMASLMIPGSKLTTIWGRKRCFIAGLIVYGAGAVLALLAQGIGMMIFGYSLLEGIGSALLIPPVYILVTVAFPDMKSRAKYFGAISGAGGLGAATGPLIGGLITSAISWRASFGLQVLVVALIVVMARRIDDAPLPRPTPRFDLGGAVLSAAGLFFVVFGVLRSSTYGWFTTRKDVEIAGTVVIQKGGVSPIWIPIGIGMVILVCFFLHLRRRERHGAEPLVRLHLFASRVANLGLSTQFVQWLAMQGSFFITSVFVQQVWHYSAIQTGLVLIPAIAGVLLTSAAAGRLARRHPQATLIVAGFVITATGSGLLLALVSKTSGPLSFAPGLFLFGAGVGIMLTSSVNVVQSAFGEADQGDISGISRSVSNLGSSFGTALAGSILVGAAVPGAHPYALAVLTLLIITLLGLVAAVFLRRTRPESPAPAAAPARASSSR